MAITLLVVVSDANTIIFTVPTCRTFNGILDLTFGKIVGGPVGFALNYRDIRLISLCVQMAIFRSLTVGVCAVRLFVLDPELILLLL